ncbi:MAG TPA: response regulator [archaeon]|nr:response regulator [archaeon]
MKKKKIYIIEDDEKYIEFYIALFDQMENIEPFFENTGDKGLEMIKSGEPDLCIIDYYLPNLDGITLCKELRKIDKFKNIPIIVISSSPLKGNKKKIFEEAGFDKWYEKPLNIKEFRENVEALLSY